jgi:zinc D-Ala-D-Ala carboxypeptidase
MTIAIPPPTPSKIAKGLHLDVDRLDLTGWCWPHFSARELSCDCRRHCKGEYYHDVAFLDALEALRALVGPIKINSARRCKGHNRAVGGARSSMHMRTLAADIAIGTHKRGDLARGALKAVFRGIGYGRTFLHVDLGVRRAWTYPGAMPAWVRALGGRSIFLPRTTGEVARRVGGGVCSPKARRQIRPPIPPAGYFPRETGEERGA